MVSVSKANNEDSALLLAIAASGVSGEVADLLLKKAECAVVYGAQLAAEFSIAQRRKRHICHGHLLQTLAHLAPNLRFSIT